MPPRIPGACQVQPSWRERLLRSLPKNGDWSTLDAQSLIGDYADESDVSDDPNFPDYDAWYEDRMEWVRVAQKEALYLGHIEVQKDKRGGSAQARLTPAGIAHVRETTTPARQKEAA